MKIFKATSFFLSENAQRMRKSETVLYRYVYNKKHMLMHAPKKDFEKDQKRTPSGIGCINGRLRFKGAAVLEQWFPTYGYRLGILLLGRGTVEVCHNNIFNCICLLIYKYFNSKFPIQGKILNFFWMDIREKYSEIP